MAAQVGDPRNRWGQMPPEIRLMIVGRMDIEASVAFRAAAQEERRLIRAFVRHRASIFIKYTRPRVFRSRAEMLVELRDMITENVQQKWVITMHRPRMSNISHRRSNDEVLSTRRLRGSIGEHAIQIVRRLCVDPLFEVKKIEFNMTDYHGNLHHGIVCADLEQIVLTECSGNGNFLDDVIFNYNFRRARISCNYENENARLRCRALIRDRPRIFARFIRFEFEYAAAFPESYEVTSLEDALTRHRQFLRNNQIITPNNNNRGVRERMDLDETVNKTMYVRAAYGNDPVRYLELNDPNYATKIQNMRSSCNAFPLRNGEIALLTLYALQALRCYGERGRHAQNHFLLYGLKSQIGLRIGSKEYKKMLKRIDDMLVA